MEEEAVIRTAAFRDIGVEDPREYERRGARSTQGGIPEGKLRVGMVGWLRRPGKGVRNGGRTRTDPGEMPAGEESDAEASTARHACARALDEQRRAVREPECLVQAEDRQMPLGAERAAAYGARPTLGDVLDQDHPAILAPSPPASRVLRKPKVMDHKKRARTPTDERLELIGIRFQGRACLIEPTGSTPAHECLHLGAVVIRRHQDLVAWLKAEHAGPYPKRMPPQRVE